MLTADGRKRCPDCREEKPATLEFFYRCKDKLQQRCKPCDNLHRGQARGHGVYDRIARALGISPVRVKQIEASALAKLRRNKLARELAQ